MVLLKQDIKKYMGNDKLKIGILTFHNAHNYGAVLQAYAMKTYLIKMGHEAGIINYINDSIAANYIKTGKFNAPLKQLHWEEQCDKFEKFINEMLLENNTEKISADQLERLSADIDVLICGSDQIWNSGLTGGLDSVYFLNFQTRAKKVSYAPSKYKNWIKEEEKNYFSKCLSHFDFLSTREYALSSELMKLVDKKIETVMDPVFLLDASDYLKIKTNAYSDIESFILVYYLVEDKKLYTYAKKMQSILKIPIVEIHFFDVESNENIQLSNCGPMEFVELFFKCSFVITNSFHGTAFSIILKKDFYAVYQEDCRKDQLLRMLNLENRRIYSDEIFEDEIYIDYETVYQHLKSGIDFSKSFLKKALRG